MNFIKFASSVVLICTITPIYAQSTRQVGKSKRNQIILSLGNGVLLNNLNVKNNDVYPNPIRASSALTYKPSITIEFQRRTKSGFMYGSGFGFGNYVQNFDVVYSSFDYVEENTRSMDTFTSYQKFRNRSLYAELRLIIGYNASIKMFGTDQYSFESRLSLSKRVYFSGGFLKSDIRLNYVSNDTIFLYNYPASLTESQWGNAGQGGLAGPLVADAYFGLRKDLKKGILNTIHFGVFATYQVHKRGTEISDRADVRVVNGHFKDGNLLRYDTDHYTNEEVVIGVKIGVGIRF